MYRVTFPFDLKLPGDADEGEEAEYTYLLKGVVVHVGSGPNHGAPCNRFTHAPSSANSQ